MTRKKILLLDDYNQTINRGGVIGSITTTFGHTALRNGWKIIEINKEEMAKIFRIRKLTARECFRLMGVSDADIDKIKESGVSESQQYKMAGNSIVVQVLEGIFTQLFRVDNESLF